MDKHGAKPERQKEGGRLARLIGKTSAAFADWLNAFEDNLEEMERNNPSLRPSAISCALFAISDVWNERRQAKRLSGK